MEPFALSEQIERILRSQTFASKRQLRKLLEVLFKNMNSQAMLTPDLVIRELWPEETRTKRSADVATEMNRLRHALESYSNGEGKADPITIILPNRSATAVDGMEEKCWIAAKPRGGECFVQPGLKPGFISNDLRGAPPQPAKQRAEWGPPESAALPWQSESQRVFQQPLRGVKIMGALTVLCAALGILVYVSIRVLTVRDPPQFGRLDGTVLRIMDGRGKELWSKSFPDGFGPDWYYDNIVCRLMKGATPLESPSRWTALGLRSSHLSASPGWLDDISESAYTSGSLDADSSSDALRDAEGEDVVEGSGRG